MFPSFILSFLPFFLSPPPSLIPSLAFSFISLFHTMSIHSWIVLFYIFLKLHHMTMFVCVIRTGQESYPFSKFSSAGYVAIDYGCSVPAPPVISLDPW